MKKLLIIATLLVFGQLRTASAPIEQKPTTDQQKAFNLKAIIDPYIEKIESYLPNLRSSHYWDKFKNWLDTRIKTMAPGAGARAPAIQPSEGIAK